MPLVGFEQDPSAPEGTGMFQFDDRAPLYARDPQTAADLKRRNPAPPPPMQPSPELMAAAAPPSDQRTASNGFQTTDQRLAGGGAAPYDAQLAALPSMAKVPAPAPPPPATGGGPPAPERPQGPMAPPTQPQQGPDVQGEAMKFITSPVRMGATQGGYRPTKQSQTVETEGLPYDPELAQQRSDAAINLQVAHMAGAKAQADRALAEQAHWQAQLPDAQRRAAEAQTEMANQQDAYKRERADLDRMISESQDNQKSFNANRWMESRGLIGQIGAVIAQAMGAYAATLSHGENWAKKIIDDAINRDIENQKAQIESGKAGVTNALQKLNLRYGDMNQAQSALKMAMQTNVDTQIQTSAAATKSQDVWQVANEWLAANQKDRVAEEQKFMAASMGKRKMETSGQIVAPSAGGMRAPTTAEMSQRADLAGKIPGIAEKTYDAELKRQKAEGGGVDKEKVRDESRNLAKDTAEIVKAQADAQPGRDLVNKYKGADSIPGLGYAADATVAMPMGRLTLSEEARVNRGTIDRTVLAYQHAMTGAGAPNAEREMITNAIKGARTPSELGTAIAQADASLAARRKHAESGYDPAVVELARKRGSYQPTEAPPSLKREDL